MLWSPWVIAGVALSAALLALVPVVWRRRGAVMGLYLTALALVPAGLALTGTLTLVGRIGRAISSFVTHLIFSPSFWLGTILLGLAVLLGVTGRALSNRGRGGRPAVRATANAPATTRPAARPAVEPARRTPATDDFSDIEELLRRRGIS